MKTGLDVNVIGLGYIGLPTAAILARSGHHVVGVDVNQELIKRINHGQFSNLEPGLDDVLNEAVGNGELEASFNAGSADVHIICVPTPLSKEESKPTPDLSYVFDAAKSLAPYLKADDLVIVESTISVGATDAVRSVLKSIGIDVNTIHHV